MNTEVLEIIAVLSTLSCVIYLNIKNVLGWPLGIIAAASYLVIFFQTELYFQSILQIVFILQSIYGWWIWKKDKDDLKIVLGNSKNIENGIFWGTFVFAIILVFQSMSPDFPKYLISLLDGYILFLALVGTYLLSKKILQAWLVWILFDICMIGLMISQELWWSSGLYVLLIINAVIAYSSWKREYYEKI